MLTLPLLTLLAATPASAPIILAAPGLTVVGADAKQQAFYTDHLAQQLRFKGLQVTTASDIAALLGHERQQQLLGCADDTCSAKVGLTLGAEGLVLGTVRKLERSWTLDVRVIASGGGQPLAQASATAGTEDELVGALAVLADQLAQQVAAKLGRTLKPDAAHQIVRGPTAVRRLAWLPGVVGLAAGVAGGVGLGLAVKTKSELDHPTAPRPPAEYKSMSEFGATAQALGWTGVGVGVASLVAAASMYVFGGDELVTTGVAVAPGHVSLNVVGVFP